MKRIILSIFVSIACVPIFLHTKEISGTYQLHDLVQDFKNYTTSNTGFHAGNLYEHSQWVSIAIHEWFEKHDMWTDGLQGHDQILAVLAGLLHDVGKAGDLQFTFFSKPMHAEKGQAYLLGKERYFLKNNSMFDFDLFFDAMKISETDRKLFSILVGAHHAFGTLLRSLTHEYVCIESSRVQTEIKNFLQKIKEYAACAGYLGPVTTRLIKLVVLVSAADVRGAQKYACMHPFDVFDFTITTSPDIIYASAPDKFKEFEYETRGKSLRMLILQNYEHILHDESAATTSSSVVCANS